MKRPFCLSGIYLRISLSLLIISFSFPLVSFSQRKEFNIVVTCVEYIGNGTFKANFGYDNPDTKAVTVDQTSSVVTYNYGQSKKFALNTFLPGQQENVFSQEFSTKDRVEWTVTLPSGAVKVATADINSNHCRDVGDIIPYYTPPPGGKVSKKSLIGAELTSLYNTYISLYPNFNAKSDFIFQLRVINGVYQVYIEAISIGPTASLKTQLTDWGFNLAFENAATLQLTGWMPIGRLLDMNTLTKTLNYARPVYPGVGNYIAPKTGLTQSQGDKVMRSDFTRLGYSIDGTGVKIGVISNSYNTRGAAATDVQYGDLPGSNNPDGYTKNVDVLKDIDPSSGIVMSDEGRAMLQIIHDIAPRSRAGFLHRVAGRTGYGRRDQGSCRPRQRQL